MADAATMTIKAVLLPEEIQATLKDLSFAYTPADANDKWFYGIVNVPHNTGGVDLITGKFLAASAGVATGTANADITTSDKVKFLFVKNTSTSDGIVISIDAGTAAFNLGDGIFVGPEQSWFCRLPNTTVADIHAISSDIGDAGDASANVIVAALIDDVG